MEAKSVVLGLGLGVALWGSVVASSHWVNNGPSIVFGLNNTGPKMVFPSSDSFHAVCNRLMNVCMPIEDETEVCYCSITEARDGNYECNECDIYRF